MSEFDERFKTVTVSESSSVGLHFAAIICYICFFTTGLIFLLMGFSNNVTDINPMSPAFLLWISGLLTGTILIALSKMNVERFLCVKKSFFNILVFAHIGSVFFALFPYVALSQDMIFVNYLGIGFYLLMFVAFIQVFSLGFICEQLILGHNKRYSPANFILPIISGVITFGIEVFLLILLILFVIFEYNGDILIDMVPGLIYGFLSFGLLVVQIVFSIILIINSAVRNRRFPKDI